MHQSRQSFTHNFSNILESITMQVRRCNAAQINNLITYMENDTLLARKQVTLMGQRGYKKFENMWLRLAKNLNNFKPSIKTVVS